MRATIIVGICIVGLFGAAFGTFRYLDVTRAQPVRGLSKMMSVRVIISEALATYYEQHGRYPSSLADLPLQTLRWGDEGSSDDDVEAWSYVSDGSSFTMTWTNARGTELFLGASAGRAYYSRDEKR